MAHKVVMRVRLAPFELTRNSVGGGGKVALHATRLLTKSGKYSVTSILRSDAKVADVKAAGATPQILSVEDDSVSAFAQAFEGAHAVIWSAGAGGKGGAERTHAVDHRGAVKVFDAIESLAADQRPRLLTVSALGVTAPGKPDPEHWNEADRERMDKSRAAISEYYKAKTAADVDLVNRSGIRYTILRPGGLSDDSATGKISLGQTHTTSTVPREDVAATLVALLDRGEDSVGIALDLIGGDTPIDQAVDNALKRGISDFHL